MIPTPTVSHEESAAALLTEKWRGKPVIEGFLRALVKPYDSLETSVWDTLEGRVLDDAAGVWLDAIGVIVGEPRQGRDDTSYRFSIRVRVRVNRSQGRAVDVIDVALLLDATATYLEYAPLGWEVEIYNTPYGGDFIRLLAQTKAASSYGVLLTSDWDVSQVSQFSDSNDGTPDDLFVSAI